MFLGKNKGESESKVEMDTRETGYLIYRKAKLKAILKIFYIHNINKTAKDNQLHNTHRI